MHKQEGEVAPISGVVYNTKTKGIARKGDKIARIQGFMVYEKFAIAALAETV